MESAALPEGGVMRQTARVHRVDAVHILAFPTKDTILMIREFRPYYGTWIWMLPSGKADKEKDMAIAAQRELREETGFRAEELTPFCSANHSESIVMTNHFFIARKLVRAPLKQDDDERIEVKTVTLQEAIDNVLSSEKIHTPSAFGLLRYWYEHHQ